MVEILIVLLIVWLAIPLFFTALGLVMAAFGGILMGLGHIFNPDTYRNMMRHK